MVYALRNLCGVLGQLGQLFAVTLGGSDDLHVLPIVRELLATIEAGNVRSGQSRGLGAALGATDGYGKAVARVPAAKEISHQFLNHDPPSIPERVCQFLGYCE